MVPDRRNYSLLLITVFIHRSPSVCTERLFPAPSHSRRAPFGLSWPHPAVTGVPITVCPRLSGRAEGWSRVSAHGALPCLPGRVLCRTWRGFRLLFSWAQGRERFWTQAGVRAPALPFLSSMASGGFLFWPHCHHLRRRRQSDLPHRAAGVSQGARKGRLSRPSPPLAWRCARG